MFKIIKNFNWIILSSFLCIFMGIVTFLTFINEGFVPLTDKNLQNLLIIDIFLLLVFFGLIFKNFYRFYYTGKKNKKGSQTNSKYISVFSLFTPEYLSLQVSVVAKEKLQNSLPSLVCLKSGSLPIFPIKKTLFKPIAINK